MIDLKIVTLNNALFLGGKNFGLTLDPSKVTGLQLQLDEDKDRIIVWYTVNNKTHVKGIKHYDTFEPIVFGDCGWQKPSLEITKTAPISAPDANPKIQAQVSGPTHHVFAKEPGHTGVGEKSPR